MPGAVEYPYKELPIDPYVLIDIRIDGSSSGQRITVSEDDLEGTKKADRRTRVHMLCHSLQEKSVCNKH